MAPTAETDPSAAGHQPAVDVHAHLAPDLSGGDPARLGVSVDGAALSIAGHRIGPPGLYRPADLLAFLDRAQLEEALVSVPPPFYRQGLRGRAAADWVTALNDGLVQACAISPRLRPLAYLPLDDPDLAVRTLDSLADTGRFAGCTGGAGGGSARLDDPALLPMWSALEDRRSLLLLHPGASPDDRLAAHYQHNLTGNPVETAVAASQLVFGGVLDRYPRLQVVLVHCGGAVPVLAGRWRRGVETGRPGLPEPPVDVTALLRRLWVDCLSHDPAVVDLAASVFGRDHLLLGSDWPYPMGTDDPAATSRHLGTDVAERIARTNPARLLDR